MLLTAPRKEAHQSISGIHRGRQRQTKKEKGEQQKQKTPLS